MRKSCNYFLAVLLKHKSSFVRLNEIIAIAAITIFEIFVVYHLCKLPINGLVFIIIMLGFLALNIYITYIINQVSKNAKLKYEIFANNAVISKSLIKSNDKSCTSVVIIILLTTKNNHIGVGLSIIKSVTEKYSGLFVEEHTDSEFKIEITLPKTRRVTTFVCGFLSYLYDNIRKPFFIYSLKLQT